MKITVTGSEGFIGQHVVRRLTTLGHEVLGIDFLDSQVHGEHPENKRRDYAFEQWPIENYPFEKDNSDVIIHLAARVGVGQSMYDVPNYVEQNSLATAALLDSLQHSKPKRLVVASSMSIYGECGTEPVREDRPPDLRSIYALTKYDQEQMCLIWGKAYKVPTVALRFFNTYGPGQSLNNPYTGVMAIFASRLLNGNPPVIYGDGTQSRDFIHVDDVANAVVHAATDEIDSGIYNVCTSERTSIKYLALLLQKELEVSVNIEHTAEREGDIKHCVGNPLKLVTTGWFPEIGVESGVKQYCEWLRTQPKPTDRFEQAHKELIVHGLTS